MAFLSHAKLLSAFRVCQKKKKLQKKFGQMFQTVLSIKDTPAFLKQKHFAQLIKPTFMKWPVEFVNIL